MSSVYFFGCWAKLKHLYLFGFRLRIDNTYIIVAGPSVLVGLNDIYFNSFINSLHEVDMVFL